MLFLVSFPGAVVIFTGLLSVAFLGRRIQIYMWIGIATLAVGLAVVGVSDVLFSNVNSSGYKTSDIVAGL